MTCPRPSFGPAIAAGILALLALAFASASPGAGAALLGTSLRDFVQPGTQPGALAAPIAPSYQCSGCHGYYDEDVEPFRGWAATMMAQATRDPIFHAALAIAEQDAQDAGSYCLRCHAPGAWLAGRVPPSDGSGLDQSQGDFDGITCNLCHRLVDPVADGENPSEDGAILAALALPPVFEHHSGQYVVDPEDRRRGPFELAADFPWHEWRLSPYHRDSLLCATCHDVSNPVLERAPDGAYRVGPLDRPHPTHDKRDEFPVERTYSEWSQSVFARAPQEMGGRFGGNRTAVASCQDCHMPDATGAGCKPGLGGIEREDLPLHTFAGANSWVLRAVRALYPDSETELTGALVDASIARNVAMLGAAADLFALERDGELVVRVVNRTGHKLPTGYGEGRRMWLNVRFLDVRGRLLAEHGRYDASAAELARDTRIWEVVHGIGDDVAQATGLPPGPSFHFVLNGTIESDNRIPPRGFTHAAFEEVQAPVVGHAYADEQYWDEARFALPAGSARIEISLHHQTTTKEYIEFLRDANTTNSAGQTAYDQWVLHGKSAPVEMASLALDLGAWPCPDPIAYGLGTLASTGTRLDAGWSGSPSVSGSGFELVLSGARPLSLGALFAGDGLQSVPFAGGQLLVTHPLRLATFVTDGLGAARVPLAIDGTMAGSARTYQFLVRDGGLPERLALSNGVHVDFCW